MDYSAYIGKRVQKLSKASNKIKPFKSGNKINTVKGITLHRELSEKRGVDVFAFTFEEDDSYVSCETCKLVD